MGASEDDEWIGARLRAALRTGDEGQTAGALRELLPAIRGAPAGALHRAAPELAAVLAEAARISAPMSGPVATNALHCLAELPARAGAACAPRAEELLQCLAARWADARVGVRAAATAAVDAVAIHCYGPGAAALRSLDPVVRAVAASQSWHVKEEGINYVTHRLLCAHRDGHSDAVSPPLLLPLLHSALRDPKPRVEFAAVEAYAVLHSMFGAAALQWAGALRREGRGDLHELLAERFAEPGLPRLRSGGRVEHPMLTQSTAAGPPPPPGGRRVSDHGDPFPIPGPTQQVVASRGCASPLGFIAPAPRAQSAESSPHNSPVRGSPTERSRPPEAESALSPPVVNGIVTAHAIACRQSRLSEGDPTAFDAKEMHRPGVSDEEKIRLWLPAAVDGIDAAAAGGQRLPEALRYATKPSTAGTAELELVSISSAASSSTRATLQSSYAGVRRRRPEPPPLCRGDLSPSVPSVLPTAPSTASTYFPAPSTAGTALTGDSPSSCAGDAADKLTLLRAKGRGTGGGRRRRWLQRDDGTAWAGVSTGTDGSARGALTTPNVVPSESIPSSALHTSPPLSSDPTGTPQKSVLPAQLPAVPRTAAEPPPEMEPRPLPPDNTPNDTEFAGRWRRLHGTAQPTVGGGLPAQGGPAQGGPCRQPAAPEAAATEVLQRRAPRPLLPADPAAAPQEDDPQQRRQLPLRISGARPTPLAGAPSGGAAPGAAPADPPPQRSADPPPQRSGVAARALERRAQRARQLQQAPAAAESDGAGPAGGGGRRGAPPESSTPCGAVDLTLTVTSQSSSGGAHRPGSPSACRYRSVTDQASKPQEEIPTEALEPVPSPERALGEAVEATRGTDWRKHFDALTTLRALAAHHPQVLAPHLQAVAAAIVKSAMCLRSAIARHALVALGDLVTYMQRRADACLGEPVGVLHALLRRCAEPNHFLAEEAERSISAMVAHCSTARVLAALAPQLAHKAEKHRAKAAKVLYAAVEKLGAAAFEIRDLGGLLAGVHRLLTDSSFETRHWGRLTASSLRQAAGADFERLCSRAGLPQKQVQALQDAAARAVVQEHAVVSASGRDHLTRVDLTPSDAMPHPQLHSTAARPAKQPRRATSMPDTATPLQVVGGEVVGDDAPDLHKSLSIQRPPRAGPRQPGPQARPRAAPGA
eukprot:TRINITY_DN1120_c0_g1_i1.p1 TRINITY_DN1120_c0_g1~~TRINITY_DN1120_c0_g1_i1.p1  ORF type:complete len:1159 (+),score=330.23 TRINITY_DN1120_c0_g1_i1:186-3662(+)